jgi:uncharacterized protein YcgL (UPF0745 family)
METFKSVVVSNIKEASMALVQEFGNPQLANMLDAAFVKMANGIGGAFGRPCLKFDLPLHLQEQVLQAL